MIEASWLQELLDYDPNTGALTWRERGPEQSGRNGGWKSFNKRFSGKVAFTAISRDGYYHGNIFGRSYQAHRVIWALVHGEWPEGQIDHINGVRLDNRLSNLRAVSNAENSKNIGRSAKNSSGHNGVVWHRQTGKWQAQIRSGGRSFYLGLFASLDAAVAARAEADRLHGFHMNHGKVR